MLPVPDHKMHIQVNLQGNNKDRCLFVLSVLM